MAGGGDGVELPLSASTDVRAAGSRSKYKKPLAEYVTVYGTTVRPIKRWIEIGKAATPVDLPPLDEPALMAAWWDNHMTTRVPAKLLAFAQGASDPGESTDALNVHEIDMSDLDSLKSARRYAAAIDKKLSAAYLKGQRADIRSWQKDLNEALDSVRKLEAAERAAQKESREVLPRGEVCSEIAQLVEVFRQMRSTMRRRITARLADLPAELLERIGNAIDRERENEDSVLRQLTNIGSVAEVVLKLEAV